VRAGVECEFTKAAFDLSRKILLPPISHLGKKRLLIVTAGVLNMVPFGALPIPETPALNAITNCVSLSGARPIITEHEIVMAPSASSLVLLGRERKDRAAASSPLVVFADPVFRPNDDRVGRNRKGAFRNGRTGRVSSGRREGPAPGQTAAVAARNLDDSFPRLPFSRREADEICSIAPGKAKKVLGFESSKEAVLDPKIREYQIIHFATHSLLNNDHPELSGIVMSLFDRQGNPLDGLVRLLDIYNLDLDSNLVVLSGCRTALGKNLRGEGLVGLTRGFMYAGAAQVIASLWKVDDEATSELMKRFYKAMLRERQRPAAALRTAQLWMQQQERWRSPNYWAAFVLQGDWK
jgi:hypothetical protein